MSLSNNIDHLAIAAGIEAVVVDTGTREYRGDDQWHRVLDGSLDLFRRTEEKSIRLVVGKHTIVVQKEGDETVAVVLPTGHAIAKSLRRMIRRMARKDRGPVSKSRDLPAHPSTQTSPQPGQPGSGVTTPSPSPMSSPSPNPGQVSQPTGQPGLGQPKTGDEVKGSPSTPSSTDRGGFRNF